MDINIYEGDLNTDVKVDLTVGGNLYNETIKNKIILKDSIDTTTVTLFSTIDATIDIVTVPIKRTKIIGAIDTNTIGKPILGNISLY